MPLPPDGDNQSLYNIVSLLTDILAVMENVLIENEAVKDELTAQGATLDSINGYINSIENNTASANGYLADIESNTDRIP